MERKTLPDEYITLVELKNGSVSALELIFKEYYPTICQFINSYIRDCEAAEEIAGDLFIYLWEKRNKINIHSSLDAYLRTAAKNRALNYLRGSKQLDMVHIQEVKESEFDMPDSEYSGYQDIQEVIDRAIESLPPQCKSIFQVYREGSKTHREIASEFDLSVKTVENQIGIALRKLRGFFRNHYKDLFISLLLSVTL